MVVIMVRLRATDRGIGCSGMVKNNLVTHVGVGRTECVVHDSFSTSALAPLVIGDAPTLPYLP